MVRQAFEETEGRLDGVAKSFKTVAKESVKDVGGLFSKLGAYSSAIRFIASAEIFNFPPNTLDRKSSVFTSNSGDCGSA